jgi:predicted nuclease of predicted toxin-antitoxin system
VGIRSAGWNAIHAQECGLKGHPDENVFAYAKREDRIIITHDPDFLDDRRFPPQQNPGIIVVPGGHGDERSLSAALDAILRIVGDSRDLWTTTKIRITPDGTWTLLTFDRDVGQLERQRYRFERGRPVEYWEDT